MIQASVYGRLGKAPEKRINKDRTKAFATASLAVDCERQQEGEERPKPEWINMVAFGKSAEALMRHKPGDLLSVIGRLERRTWTDKEGNERKSFGVVVEQLVSVRSTRPGGGKKKEADDDVGF